MRALGPGEAVACMKWPRVARPGKRQQPFWVVCSQVWALQWGSFSVTGLFYLFIWAWNLITGWRSVSLSILGADVARSKSLCLRRAVRPRVDFRSDTAAWHWALHWDAHPSRVALCFRAWITWKTGAWCTGTWQPGTCWWRRRSMWRSQTSGWPSCWVPRRRSITRKEARYALSWSRLTNSGPFSGPSRWGHSATSTVSSQAPELPGEKHFLGR